MVPVCNIIRSTNQPGTITVTVSSPGLESASIKVSSVLPAADDTFITEFDLNDDGRQNVSRDETSRQSVELLTGIMNIRENHKLEGKSKEQISMNLSAFIRHRNYGLDQNSAGFKAFVAILSDKTEKLNGELIADDYNFLAGQFNIWFTLEQMIIRSNIPREKHAKMLKDYAEKIIVNANPVDMEKEKALIEKY